MFFAFANCLDVMSDPELKRAFLGKTMCDVVAEGSPLHLQPSAVAESPSKCVELLYGRRFSKPPILPLERQDSFAMFVTDTRGVVVSAEVRPREDVLP